MINFNKAKFIKSAPSYREGPFDKAEIIVIGKSNVGKSTLINALTNNSNLAKTSSKPGHTKLLNYFLIDDSFYLVDAPGYGYTLTGSKHLDSFAKMMESYFDNPKLKGIIFLIDSRHEMSRDDKDFFEFILTKNLPVLVTYTKCDKLNQSEKAKMLKRDSLNIENTDLIHSIFTSSTNKTGIDVLKKEIAKII